MASISAPAWRDGRNWPHRPRAGPEPGPRRRRPPPDRLVRDGHRPGRARHRARLRPTRTRRGEDRQTPATRVAGRPRPARRGPRGRRTGIRVHGRPPARPARRVRDLAAGHRDPRTAGPDHPARTDRHRRMRSPPRGPRSRSGCHAEAPDPGPARHLHRPHLPTPRRTVRLRAQHPIRGRRTHLPVQRRPKVPSRPSAQARPSVDSRTAGTIDHPVDNPGRTAVHH